MAATAALRNAKRPVIWAGQSVMFSGATDALRAELTATPVFCTMPGKSAFDERHPLALGAGSGTNTGPANDWLTGNDVMLALGTSLTRTPYSQKVKPSKFCLNMKGGGAFGMSGTDIKTAARSGAAITTLLLNNSAMATYSGPTRGTIGEEARNEFGVSTMHGNYAQIAEGMGAVGLRVTKAAELGPALKEAQKLNAEGKTVLVEVLANVEERRSRF